MHIRTAVLAVLLPGALVPAVSAVSAVLTLGARSAHADPVPVTVRADAVLRGVPPRFLGANFSSYGKSGKSPADFAPCCLSPLGALGRPLALWRTPGGILGSFFHFLTGTYDDSPDGPPNGVTFDSFVKAATDNGAGLLHVLNWNAADQELLNLIEYANGPVPDRVEPGWGPTSYRQQEAAPKGYFPWLRQLRGRPRPVGLRYVTLGNEIWNSGNDRDTRCNHDATCYGQKGAELFKKLKAQDGALQIGVSGLVVGRSARPDYRNADVYAGFRAAGVYPDFVSDHAYFRCGYGAHDEAQAESMIRWADGLADAAARGRAELVAAFPDCGRHIGLFLDEFGPQACAAGPEPFESFTPWAAAAVAHVYAAALHAGYSHASYYAWNGDPQTQDSAGYGLVNGDNPGTVDASFWGLWFASRLLGGAVSEVALDGLPQALRGVAVHAPGLVRLLLINTSAKQGERLRVQVEGRTARGANALSYVADAQHGGLMNPLSRRSQVPQQPPAAQPQRLDAVDVPPLSTVLLEIDVGDAAAPPGVAAATGCMPETVTGAPAPDMAPPGRPPPPPPPGCACRLTPPGSGVAGGAAGPGLAALVLLALLLRRARRT